MLAWRIPWTEEPSRILAMGSQKVGHEWATSSFTCLFQAPTHKWTLTKSALLTPPLWVEEEGGLQGRKEEVEASWFKERDTGILIHTSWFCSVLIFWVFSFIVCPMSSVEEIWELSWDSCFYLLSFCHSHLQHQSLYYHLLNHYHMPGPLLSTLDTPSVI